MVEPSRTKKRPAVPKKACGPQVGSDHQRYRKNEQRKGSILRGVAEQKNVAKKGKSIKLSGLYLLVSYGYVERVVDIEELHQKLFALFHPLPVSV